MHSTKRRSSFEIASTPKRLQTPRTRTIGFLDFPAELRNQIYELALVTRKSISVLGFASPTFKRPEQRLRLCPALLRACSQVREEGEKVLYGANSFTIVVPMQPAIMRVFQWHRSAPGRDSNVICLSDRPEFQNRRCKSIWNFEVVLSSIDGPHAEPDRDGFLLDDICTAFLGRGAQVEVLKIRVATSSAPALWRAPWQDMLEIDCEMAVNRLGSAILAQSLTDIIIDANDESFLRFQTLFLRRFPDASFNVRRHQDTTH